MKCKNCGTQLTKEIKFCPRCGAPNEKKGMSKPLLITLICLTVVVVSLAVTFVTLMLRNKSGNPGTFDFTCSQYTEEMNRILGEEKLDQDKWVINDTSAEYNDTGFEIDLDIEEKSKHVSKISVGPADSEDAVKIASVSIMVTEVKLTQKDVLNQLADLKEEKQDKIENDNSTVTIDDDKNRYVIEPREDKEEKTSAPATQAQSTTVQPTTEAPHEYTALELIDKDLNEIIGLMNNEFTVEQNNISVGFGSDGMALMVIGKNDLPGLAFCLSYESGSYLDITNGVDVEEKVRQGNCQHRGIAVYGSGKLNEKISADMTYNELAAELGEFDTNAVGQETLVYSTEVDGYTVSFFWTSDGLPYGNVSAAQMAEVNPKLNSIAIKNDNPSSGTNQTAEWKKLYIDHINNEYSNYSKHATPQYALAKIDDDDIPELLVHSTSARSMIDNYAYFIWLNDNDIKTENAFVSEYKEKGETFYSETLTHGHNFVSYRFDGTNFSSVHKALYYMEKQVDGEAVDDATYNSAVAEIQTYGDTKPVYVSKDEIISQIEQY